MTTCDDDRKEFIEKESANVDTALRPCDAATAPSKRGIAPPSVVPLITSFTGIANLLLTLTR